MTALEARKLAEDEMKAGKTPKYKDLRDWLSITERRRGGTATCL